VFTVQLCGEHDSDGSMQPLVVFDFVYLFEELHNGFGSLLSSPSTTAFDHETQGFSRKTNKTQNGSARWRRAACRNGNVFKTSRDVHTATSSLWLGVLRRRHGRRLFCLFGVLTSLEPRSDGERLRRRVAPHRRAHEGA